MKVTLNLRFAQDIGTNLASDGSRIKRFIQPQVNGRLMASQCREREEFIFLIPKCSIWELEYCFL